MECKHEWRQLWKTRDTGTYVDTFPKTISIPDGFFCIHCLKKLDANGNEPIKRTWRY